MAHVKQLCDFCSKPALYDAMSVMGPWAYMCEDHFERLAVKARGTYSLLEPVELVSKVCSVCGEEKPVSAFYKYVDKRGVTRYRNECKSCNLATRKVRRFKKG